MRHKNGEKRKRYTLLPILFTNNSSWIDIFYQFQFKMLCCLFLAIAALLLSLSAAYQMSFDSSGLIESDTGVSVAFLGNSVLYYNDCPRLLENMSTNITQQDSVLRGGADLKKLLRRGNGDHFKMSWSASGAPCSDVGQSTVASLFQNKKWDYVVINDRMQNFTYSQHLSQMKQLLAKSYAPLFVSSGATPILLATHAPPRILAKSSRTISEYVAEVYKGYEAYAAALSPMLDENHQPRIAPVGRAFEYIYNNSQTMYEKLFHTDDYHASPYGTYLQACVLHCTIFSTPPPLALPNNITTLWNNARYMQKLAQGAAPDEFPSYDDAVYLLNVASSIACPQ
jgi:hypothetical protein